MQNMDELHVTGKGQVQELFIHYIADTSQFKNTVAKHSTSNKMTDEKLVEFIGDKFRQIGSQGIWSVISERPKNLYQQFGISNQFNWEQTSI